MPRQSFNTTAVAPDITQVVGSSGSSIPDGGTAADTVVTVYGTGLGVGDPSTVVRDYDGQTLLGNPSVELDNTWSLRAGTLSQGLHRFSVYMVLNIVATSGNVAYVRFDNFTFA